jgi:hypothetical protein
VQGESLLMATFSTAARRSTYDRSSSWVLNTGSPEGRAGGRSMASGTVRTLSRVKSGASKSPFAL